jgi:tRNA pseudouridine13 synthase
VRVGDLAYKHDNGAVFLVEDAGAEAPRAAGFEISPTGPIYGGRMTRATGEPGRIEAAILDEEQLTIDAFGGIQGVKVHGSRRPLRFAMRELAVETGSDDAGPFVELAFAIDSGCYATMILREICKEALSEGLADGQTADDAD